MNSIIDSVYVIWARAFVAAYELTSGIGRMWFSELRSLKEYLSPEAVTQ